MGNCQAACLNTTNAEGTTMNCEPAQQNADDKSRHSVAAAAAVKAEESNEKKFVSKKSMAAHKAAESKKSINNTDQTEEDEEDDYDDNYAAEQIKKKNERGHKTISAEAYGQYNKKGEFKAKVIPKSAAQKQRILQRLEKAFMFSALDEKEQNIVIDAMQEKHFHPDEYVIKQGESGDHLYVVDSGELDCYKKFKPDQPDTYLKTYQPGESFGELALLYNVPRAASIKAKTEAVLFELDRETFNNIVKDSAVKKRERYEDFLQKVEILKGMDPYERSKVADVLKTEKHKAGEYIIKQGENGETFYFIEEGEAVATKKDNPNATEKEVYHYTSGGFFGELALKNNAPRQASVKAKTDIILAVIDRESFKRVLGPIDKLIEKQKEKYIGYHA